MSQVVVFGHPGESCEIAFHILPLALHYCNRLVVTKEEVSN